MSSTNHFNSLKFTCWNVNGLHRRGENYCKLDDKDLIVELTKYDIVGLVETHSMPDETPSLPDFKCFTASRAPNSNARKPSGGISVYIKKDLAKGITYNERSGDHAIWLRLKKEAFNTHKDIYVGIAYLPPENSPYSKVNGVDVLDILEEDILLLSAKGNIVLMGDVNGRTGKDLDFIAHDSTDYIPIGDDFPYMCDSTPPHRANQDLVTNERGKGVMDLCVSAGLRILNGRFPGDSLGYYTCHKYNGSSTVDYGIVSESLLSSILFFHVHKNLSSFSDHCRISFCLKNMKVSRASAEKVPMRALPPGFKWDEESIGAFQSALCRLDTMKALNEFTKIPFPENAHGIQTAVDKFHDIVMVAANASLRTKRLRKQRARPHKEWFGSDLKRLKREVESAGRLLCMYPRDPFIRGNYHKLLQTYRRTCKAEHRKFKNTMIKTLDNLHESNPRQYWELVNKLTEKSDDKSPVDAEVFYKHYMDLNKGNETLNNKQQDIISSLKKLEDNKVFNQLDFKISDKEILLAIKSLKLGKATGLDQISNEMIKAGQSAFIAPLCKIFNLILTSGQYPAKWTKGKILPLHKKGDRNDPANFRGITLSSCLGKLFNSILNTRLTTFLEENNLIPIEQIGFKKNHRTFDHLFIVRNLMEKYKKNKKPLYLCFIDFRKAFDTVWHAGLLFKLASAGISSKFYAIIKSMYLNVQLTVQCGNYISPFFYSRSGVRQGDNLSPTLFNLFTSDIPALFEECDAPEIGRVKLSCLLYADDLIIFSESQSGIQKALSNLERYCDTWLLEVNAEKSKLMCVNARSSGDKVMFNGNEIERTSSYIYLGIELNEECKFDNAKNELYKKGLKVYFKLSKSISPMPKANTMLHLFDHLIKPLLLYGCEIWGIFNLNFREPKPTNDPRLSFLHDLKTNYPIASRRLDSKDPLEKLHTKICKYILGVNNRAPNLGVYGELGRSPLYIDQINACIKYFYHLEYSRDNKLLQKVYNSIKTNETSVYKNGLGGFSEKIHNLFGLKLAADSRSSQHLVKNLRSRLRNKFLSYWTDSIHSNFSKSNKAGGNKLRTYKLFKTQFKREKYLDLPNYSDRKLLAKLRIGAHRLRIETDRFSGAGYIPPSDRVCQNCDLDRTEDECHFLVECPAYKEPRNILFESIATRNRFFHSYNTKQKFIWLLTSDDLHDVKLVASFLGSAMSLRVTGKPF